MSNENDRSQAHARIGSTNNPDASSYKLTSAMFDELARACDPKEHEAYAFILGRLSHLLLIPEVLQCASNNPSSAPEKQEDLLRWIEQPSGLIPEAPGSTRILFYTRRVLAHKRGLDERQEATLSTGLLRGAFVLPLQWYLGEKHCPRLPSGLGAFAEGVKGVLENIYKKSHPSLLKKLQQGWCLRLDPILGQIDLSAMEFGYESGWYALASGLLLACDNLHNPKDVFITAARSNEHAVDLVDGVLEKAKAAKVFGASKLIAATLGYEDLDRELVDIGLELVKLDTTSQVKSALNQVLRALRVRENYDPDEDNFTACCGYADLFDHAGARDNYIVESGLSAALAERDIRRNQPPQIHSLAMVLSTRSAALLSLLILRPTRCLIIHSSRNKKDPSKLQNELAQWLPILSERLQVHEAKLEQIPSTHEADELEQIKARVKAFFAEAPGERLALDLTGGTSGMKGAAMMAAIEHTEDVGLCYIDTSTPSKESFRHIVGHEKLVWLKELAD